MPGPSLSPVVFFFSPPVSPGLPAGHGWDERQPHGHQPRAGPDPRAESEKTEPVAGAPQLWGQRQGRTGWTGTWEDGWLGKEEGLHIWWGGGSPSPLMGGQMAWPFCQCQNEEGTCPLTQKSHCPGAQPERFAGVFKHTAALFVAGNRWKQQ